MNRTLVIFLGVVATVASSYWGLVLVPDKQVAPLAQHVTAEGTAVPPEPLGTVVTGRDVYIDLGCVYCHSQQVRPPGYGADIERGWGTRQTVPRDHIYDAPPLLGTMRTGPDLANIGARQPSRQWHLLHLYNPRITSPGSVMPPHPFLFDHVPKERGIEPAEALSFPDAWEPESDYVVPTERAHALVDYLLSLDHTYDLPEVASHE